MNAIAVGDRAPDFTLRRTLDESVRLADLLVRGPVVLFFYVFDFGEY
jgi:peroxiredoxin